ncbi:hypothetical protein CCUG60885_01508 [Mycobacteroides salmoniphilum]|uniref:DUF4349 domain-containing protein n=1 Tax=Mycobacteroides salmoniphilum TaxID=404941 RepID=A0A4R8SEX9_9MYCO|nr:DUF4349 domain-containing protein [Mycobacteroides salmoniphilum]TDZ95377.1 hypothetical protein CCUG60885_01508 [Mycobacteroides salmoniphilum]TEA04473.1 hypothetical protein CCUG60883_01766 [Mycobacteroides salmoniphilum]
MTIDDTQSRRSWLPWATTIAVLLIATTACAGGTSSHLSQGADDAPAATGAPTYTQAPAAPMRSESMQQAPQYGPPTEAKRDIVKTGTMTITVSSPSEAADKAAGLAESANGRVESRSEDAGSGSSRAHTAIVLRVPAAKLDGVLRDLKELGKVKSADTKSDDVTGQRVDMDARIAALQTSVDRLLVIMRDSKDTEALIQAETELSKRQADLDSLRAQRNQLGEQVAYSSVTVTFLAEEPGLPPTPPKYQGFFGQIERGWDGLVAAGNNVLLLFGLLLPWLGAFAVLGGIGYGVRRVVQQRRSEASRLSTQKADTP